MLNISKIDSRYKVILKSSIIASIAKAVIILSSFYNMRLLLDYLGKSNYGVWLTMSSIISWLTFFDLGVNAGLQNKLTKLLAVKDFQEARKHIATTYLIVSVIFIFIYLVLIIVFSTLNWSSILNVNHIENNYLFKLIFLLTSSIFAQLLLKLCFTVFFANQITHLTDITYGIASILTLISIYLLSIYGSVSDSLIKVCLIINYIPVIIFAIATLYIFFIRFRELLPSVSDIDKSKFKTVLSTSFKFLILQVFTLVMITTDNFVISRYISVDQVVTYNISTKYFSILTLPLNVLFASYTSVITHSYQKKDFKWIDKAFIRILYLFLFSVGIGIFLFLIYPFVYKWWLGSGLKISTNFALLCLTYTIIMTYTGILNGIIIATGKLDVLCIATMVLTIINIPTAILLIKVFNLGVSGVMLSNVICWSLLAIVSTGQVYKLLYIDPKNIENQ